MGKQTVLRVAGLSISLALLVGVHTFAVEPASNNYRFDETSVGVSSMLESNSANFRAQSGAGDTAIGASGSTNFQTEAGSDTSRDPNLTVNVLNGSAGFGTFSPSTASTATAQFEVINYTSFGYVAQLVGNAPTRDGDQINAMASTAPSQPGTEQFGVNLVANTSPVSFGQNLDNGTAPNDFGYGTVAANYGTPNQFRYVSGETVAIAPRSSGKTVYTISYMINVSSLTPGGIYTSDQTLVVTGTY